MIIKDSTTLRELTSSWFESNDFDVIKQDIELEVEELAKIIGDDIIEEAELIANKDNPTEDELNLLKRVQLPIALMATYRYYQSNIVSHDQLSRKVKIDDANEKIPWEWMLDRDDAAHLAKAQRGIDRLIAYLEKTNNSNWNSSDQKKSARKLFVNNTEVFGEYYPIDNSARFYYLAIPLLREVQSDKIRKALGSDYKILLEAFQNGGELNDLQMELLDLSRRALVLATIALAVRRLNIKVLPDGIIKTLKSQSQTSNANRPAAIDEISYFSKRIELDAFEAIDEIKRKRFENTPEFLEYKLLPNNDPKDKFAST